MAEDTVAESVIWRVCPILRAADECDMPEIMHGPHPECRRCPATEPRGGTAGCRIVADLVARAAIAAYEADLAERGMVTVRKGIITETGTSTGDYHSGTYIERRPGDRDSKLRASLVRVRAALRSLINDSKDPGSEALAAEWEAGEVLARTSSAARSEPARDLEAER